MQSRVSLFPFSIAAPFVLSASTIIAMALAAALALNLPSAATAEADGPDHYRIHELPETGVLLVYQEPDIKTRLFAGLEPGTDGLENLGCQGGLTLAEYQQATEAERDAARRSRWCRIADGDAKGWVAGRFLVEGSAPSLDPDTPATTPKREVDESHQEAALDEPMRVLYPPIEELDGTLGWRGRLQGRETVDYRVSVTAGQTLTANLLRDNRFLFFNVLPPGSQGEAIFTGSSTTDSESWSAELDQDGEYTVRLFLMRNAARRGESGLYTLRLVLRD